MPLPNAARRWKTGDKFSAGHLNEAVNRINSVHPLTGSPGIDVVPGTVGTALMVRKMHQPAAAELPTPQYQNMVYSGVAANQGGWDYVRSHNSVE